MNEAPLLIVDAANVVGSVPDKWWLDREGATIRLRDALAAIARDGTLPSSEAGLDGPVEVVLVVEGAARKVRSIPDVRVVAAPGSGDDAIVDLVRVEAAARTCVVVTADRELRNRVAALGGRLLGPRAVRRDMD